VRIELSTVDDTPPSPELQRIIELVSSLGPLDVTRYKASTLSRQVQRQMTKRNCSSLADYFEVLGSDPNELKALQQSFLISVTSFFRDEDAFDALREALAPVLAAKAPGDSFRVWVPGCATGEEAYSIAIVVNDLLGPRSGDVTVRVYATDVDTDALRTARNGRYSQSAVCHIPEHVRSKYFVEEGAQFRVSWMLREQCVFAPHDLIRQHPFVRMDLVSCRNVLIYFAPNLQSELYRKFHYSLNPDGHLLLGKSEAACVEPELFSQTPNRARLFRRKSAPPSAPLRIWETRTNPIRSGTARTDARPAESSLQSVMQDALLDAYAPVSVIVDSALVPLRSHGKIERFMSLPATDGELSLLSMCSPDLASEIRMLLPLLDGVRNSSLKSRPIPLSLGDERTFVQVGLRAVPHADTAHRAFVLVSFEERRREHEDAAAGELAPGRMSAEEFSDLSQELFGTRQHLEAVIEELEASNEELQSMSEEVQASTEELQASNEELEASNEELTSVNDVLLLKSKELADANDALSNIQNSIRIGLVVVDQHSRVVRFNQLAHRIFGLMQSDIGHSLTNVPCTVALPDLRPLLTRAISGGETVTVQLRDADRHLLMQIFPHFTAGGERTGAVLTFTDVSEARQAELEQQRSEERFRLFMDNSPTVAWLTDADGRFVYVNAAFERRFGFGLAPPSDAAPWVHQVAETLRAGNLSAFGARGQVETKEDLPAHDGQATVWRIFRIPCADVEGTRFLGGIGVDETEQHRARAAQTASEEHLRLAIEASEEGHWEWDAVRQTSWWSDAYDRILGPRPKESSGSFTWWLGRIHPEDVARVDSELQKALLGDGDFWSCEYRFIRPDGREIFARERASIRRDESGRALRMVGCVIDRTRERQAEDQLRLAARVFERAGEGIVVTDADQTILTVNAAFTKVTGYEAFEAIGKTPRLLASGRQDADFYKELWSQVREFGSWQGEIWNRRKNGSIYPEWLTINAILNQAGAVTNYVGIFTDITAIKESQRRVEFMATHDELTGLPNRAVFFDRLERLIAVSGREKTSFAVLFADLDNFKIINDSLGHTSGDELLRGIGTRLLETIRGGDTVARFGGDEFVLLIPNIDAGVLQQTINRIVMGIERPFSLGGQFVHPSASIGVSVFPQDGSDAERLVQNADSAMYLAKEQGKRSFCFFNARLREEADERLILETELRAATKGTQLYLVYQPQVCLATGAVVGVEALVRWSNPRAGNVSPAKFVPLAEKVGFILELGEFVLDASLRQLAAWNAKGRTVPKLSINLSAVQLREQSIVRRIADRLATYEIDPAQVTFEVTESALVSDLKKAEERLRDLKELGVGISLDDFGTGYSSLTFLRRFPIDELKIDRSFVSEIDSNADDRTIAATVLAMARSLGRGVVAEGIETSNHFKTLVDLGCPVGQGYYFSRPVDSGELKSEYSTLVLPAS
jgi:diguanylate cyclase (GGDEF)-like protein/PAS domain S-box-containing protein